MACLLAVVSISQVFGPEIPLTGKIHEPRCVSAADLDGDGDIDLLTASQHKNKITWFENDNGVVTLADDITTSALDAFFVTTGDLDGDGDIDVLSASPGDDMVAWYENDGSANFSDEIIITQTANGVSNLALSDLDQDGDIDVLSASEIDNLIAWYENDGFGNFSSEIIISEAMTGTRFVSVADLDADGDLDVLATAADSNKAVWFENNGDEDFSEEHLISNSVDTAFGIYPADFDNDNDIDLLITEDPYTNRAYWHENDGSGNFIAEHLIDASSSQDFQHVMIEDMDNDNDNDIVIVASSSIRYYINDGNGEFADYVDFTESLFGTWMQYGAMADIDGDSDIDIISLAYGQDQLAWSENDGNLVFNNHHIITGNTSNAETVVFSDADYDGDTDILCAAYGESAIMMFENDGDQNFTQEVEVITGQSYPRLLHAGDINGDGYDDLVFVGNGSISWSANDGSGAFGEPNTLAETTTFNIHLVDIDLDGDLDILSAHYTQHQILLWVNQGGGVFGSSILIAWWSSYVTGIDTGDLDGDGDLDILAGSSTGQELSWHEQEDDGSFSNEKIISNSDDADNVLAADMDGDGDLDFLASNHMTDDLRWWENDGSGSFTTKHVIGNWEDGVSPIQVGDVDLDGDIDIIAALLDDHEIRLYENCGNNVFAPPVKLVENFENPQDIQLGDLDGDGDLDLAAASYDNDKVSLFENLSNKGCMDDTACNYDSSATEDDGNCCYGVCGCNDPDASNYSTEAECGNGTCTYLLTGMVFNDINANGFMGEDDYGIPFQQVFLEPQGLIAITNDQGEFTFEIPGEVKGIEISVGSNTTFPFNSTSESVFVHAADEFSDTIVFGLSSSVPQFGICVDLYPDGFGFLCNDWTNYNVCYRNMGNVPISGIVEFEFDELFQDYAAVTPIDSVVDNTIYMSFENLMPWEMFFYDVSLLTPTADFLGDDVTNIARVTGFYEGSQVAYGEKIETQEITCAYDPNDKQVFPLGYTEEHWVLQETEQEFLVRFQNTGNAPAQNVVIRDTLDTNFDLETFKLIANSHSVMTTLDPNSREIVFFFEGIMLPDSVNNEPDSHGLVSYKITPLAGLTEGTVLENTAYIYFDNNDPIVTNTTWTTIHECGGESSFITESAIICEEWTVGTEATYPHLESWQWTVDGEILGTGAIQNWSVTGDEPYNIILEASNPLCSETSSVDYDPVDFELLNPCLADYNCDGERNSVDLLQFLVAFGCTGSCVEDITGDDEVDAGDLLLFLTLFNLSCWQ